MHFWEGHIVSHVCVKEQNNNINSLWATFVFKCLSQYDRHQLFVFAVIQWPWCWKLYSTWMVWSPCNQNIIFAMTYTWQRLYVAIAGMCHHVNVFKNITFPFSVIQDVNREQNTNKENVFRWKYLCPCLYLFHQAKSKVWWTSTLQYIFIFKETKTKHK